MILFKGLKHKSILYDDELQEYLTKEIYLFQNHVESYFNQYKEKFNDLIKAIQQTLETQINANIKVYGSFATDLHLPESDIDLVIEKKDYIPEIKNQAISILEDV